MAEGKNNQNKWSFWTLDYLHNRYRTMALFRVKFVTHKEILHNIYGN